MHTLSYNFHQTSIFMTLPQLKIHVRLLKLSHQLVVQRVLHKYTSDQDFHQEYARVLVQ